jgi:hypothetical protein
VRLGLMGLRYQYTECRTFYQSLAKEKCPVEGCAPRSSEKWICMNPEGIVAGARPAIMLLST